MTSRIKAGNQEKLLVLKDRQVPDQKKAAKDESPSAACVNKIVVF
ncbi:MAG: hypothetical protein PHV90_02920 [Smithella sp.]|jgi:hypothetical protein|nr:hypothetical protein [Smithella sp.]MDD5524169.1 hypothetical protein [Smithella sp.]